ncbi:MAG: ABC-type bacteriocin/lantibiotic exporter with N-terminal double-glycine peptidase domain [bacterium]|nr:ABC-type bacteriocin/lantibiotic exporter with N-terminal double-glycine peptidase domain [bacterium]
MSHGAFTAWLRRMRRVPVVHQVSSVDCGIACLQMIAGYFRIPSAQATTFEVGRDGASAGQLARAARAIGLDCRAVAARELADLRGHLPAIVYWRFDHYVVVERIGPRHAEIVDPAVGRRRVLLDEVDRCFTGIALTFERSATTAMPRTAAVSPLRVYLSATLKERSWGGFVASLVGLTLLLQLLGLGVPSLTAVTIDAVIPLRAGSALPRVALLGMLVVAAMWAAQVARAALTSLMYASIDAAAMQSLFKHLLALPLRFFQLRPPSDLMQRLGSHAVIRDAFTTRTLSAILDVLFAGGCSVLLWWIAPPFAIVTLASGVLSLGLVLLSTRQLSEVTHEHITAQSGSQTYASEALLAIATLKAMGAEERVLRRWSSLLGRQLSASARREQHVARVEAGLNAIRLAASVAILWLGARDVESGRQAIGQFVACSSIALGAIMPFSSIAQTIQQLLLVRAHLVRIADILSQPTEATRNGRQIEVRGAIELRDVTFRYHAGGALVLSNVSLRVEPGEKVAIVGGTGSGKSTLGMLLLGLLRPTSGDVLIDGQALDELDLTHLRRQCGVVLQDPMLLGGTLRENIALAAPGLDLDGVAEAARVAEIGGDVDRMLMGYATRLGPGGSGLSGGQRQRVALARAVALKPRILLLDEATSALDVLTEERVDGNVGRLSCTRIVIAHRLSTVRNAAQIFVLDGGVIVERGTHDELVRRRGRYWALVESQLAHVPPRTAALAAGGSP